MDKIGLKRLKRKRKLHGRIKCHGDKSRCSHHTLKITPKVKIEVKLNWWEKLLKWLNLI